MKLNVILGSVYIAITSLFLGGCAKNTEKILVIAHRGASGYLPEHTLPAKALSFGMFPDFIEQDVVLSKDNVPVIIHDIYLERTTNVAKVFPNKKREDGKYYVIDFTWNELQQLKVTERFNSKSGQAIYKDRFPINQSNFKLHTLSDEIGMIQGLNKTMNKDVGIYVEIKEPKFHRDEGKSISEIVLKVLTKYGYTALESNCVLQCFDAYELKKIREEYKSELFIVQLLEIGYSDEVFRNMNVEDMIDHIAVYANGVGPWYKQLIEGKDKVLRKDFDQLIKLAHKKGLKVHAFTFRADDLGDKNSFNKVLKIAEDLEVDGVFTDHPDKAIAYFKK